MSDDKKDLKKGFSNSFLLFVVVSLLMMVMLQGFMDGKSAKVAFSYQLEHLVNLQLIQPEDSRKVALNDKLVTFSGKFRQRLTEEGKERFAYLTQLDDHERMAEQRTELQQEISQLREKIQNAGSYFLAITGVKVPEEGFVVVDEIHDTYDQKHQIVVKAPKPMPENFSELERNFQRIKAAPTSSETTQRLEDLGLSLSVFIRSLKSPQLGIGNLQIKQQLKEFDQQIEKLLKGSTALSVQLTEYEQILQGLDKIILSLIQPVDHMRLSQLRSVRSYREQILEYDKLQTQYEENLVQLDKARELVTSVIWYFNNQELSTRSLEKQDPELFGQWYQNANEEWKQFPENRGGDFRAPDQPLNLVLEKSFKSEEPAPNYANYFITFLPFLLVGLVLYFLFARQMKGVGSSAMNFGKSPAKLLTKEKNKITFKDVAGIDEAIEELQEIVDFLKNPKKFTALGGRIPKGVLCIGPPGTGKTLVAKAVAGEADRPFFSISGSDFVEMFVGVGASRIRDMFEQAKKNAPCIIFMDEIDAVGRHRGAGIGGGHDEREQTLNQLLVEMDGFDTNDGVILVAATNRPDVLDKALLRPGRFDRRIVISLPDVRGRYEILKVHAKKIKLDANVDLMDIARATPGASGADLENILNESALAAARKGRTAVTPQEVREACDKVRFGKERRSLELDEEEKLTTAYHESGHAIVGLVVEHADPVEKVTIIPRGMSLGSTMFLPKKNRLSYWKRELHDQLAVLMGGRAAEEIFVGDVGSGARQDIEQATKITRSMICEWGMSDELGVVAYDERTESGQYLGLQGYSEKRYSEATAQMIDQEVKRISDEAHARAVRIIKDNHDAVEMMTKMLMEFETLDATDVRAILRGDFSPEEKHQRLKEEAELHKVPKKKKRKKSAKSDREDEEMENSPDVEGTPAPQPL
ncbi:MAG: ATP-dependent zinc metalloprotease FtsH [Chlamydiia bacterium]|nr:ATP-dependent zinc metalloprotease FtsH [Chlamydiia bacterium]